jgi:hypothetical protein
MTIIKHPVSAGLYFFRLVALVMGGGLLCLALLFLCQPERWVAIVPAALGVLVLVLARKIPRR